MQSTPTLESETVESVLKSVFLETMKIYWKTHSYHWNIESNDFYSLHGLFEKQYTSLWEAIDEIAERFRVMKIAAPSILPALSAKPYGTSRKDILEDLIEGHDSCITLLRKSIDTLEKLGDIAGADFLTSRLAEHEKMLWMLQSTK